MLCSNARVSQRRRRLFESYVNGGARPHSSVRSRTPAADSGGWKDVRRGGKGGKILVVEEASGVHSEAPPPRTPRWRPARCLD